MKWPSGTQGKDIWRPQSLSESTTAAHCCQDLSDTVQRRQIRVRWRVLVCGPARK